MSILPKVSRVKREANSALKILLYAPPGFGKSYWANQFPDPLFLNTDGNLQYLDAAGVVVKHWYSHPGNRDKEAVASSFVNIVEELVMTNGGGFKTIVVDLLEGVYDLCRTAKLREFNIQDEGDIPFGKVYKMIRSEVLAQINRLRALPVNVILLSHEKELTIKDRVGREYTFYTPNVDDKFLKPLSGTGFTLRGYWKDVTNERTQESTAVRMLSLTPKSEEFRVTRFTDTDGTPVVLEDIELTYEGVRDLFARLSNPANAGSFVKADSSEMMTETASDYKEKLTKPRAKPVEKVAPVNKPIEKVEKVEKVEKIEVEPAPVKKVEVKPAPVKKVEPTKSSIPVTETQQERIARIHREIAEKIANAKKGNK